MIMSKCLRCGKYRETPGGHEYALECYIESPMAWHDCCEIDQRAYYVLIETTVIRHPDIPEGV